MIDEQLRTAYHALGRCHDIMEIDPWNSQPAWAAEAVVTLLVINLKDALMILDALGERINFTDDIEEGDITKRVADFRNSACHIGSLTRFVLNRNRLGFGIAAGQVGLLKMGDIELKNPYADDVAYFVGALRLYHNRHLARAVTEAEAKMRSLAEVNEVWLPSARS